MITHPLEHVFTGETSPTPRFIIAMTPEQADRAKAALNALGIDFDPHRDMATFGHTECYNDIVCGADTPDILPLIADYLRELRLDPQLPHPKDLDTRQLADLLHLTQSELHWDGYNGVAGRPADYDTSPADWWQGVTERHPSLLQENPAPANRR